MVCKTWFRVTPIGRSDTYRGELYSQRGRYKTTREVYKRMSHLSGCLVYGKNGGGCRAHQMRGKEDEKQTKLGRACHR